MRILLIVISGPSLIVNVNPVKASIAGLNPADVRDQMETIMRGRSQQKLAKELSLPKGITLEYGGVYQTQQESFRGLLLVSLAAVFALLPLAIAIIGGFSVSNFILFFGLPLILSVIPQSFVISFVVETFN